MGLPAYTALGSIGQPIDLTIVIEGEEEVGSKNFVPFLGANKHDLEADYALVCDTGMWNAETPSITTSLRGLVYEDVKLTCADRDLHSGLFGGAAQNPIRVLSKILAAIHDDQGRVTIPGFYDGVPELPADIRADLAGLNLTAEQFLGQVGLKVPAGEKDRMLIEQIATRPTAEINGMIGGYTGEGAKTVIPGEASAKVSFRLVGQQVLQAHSGHGRAGFAEQAFAGLFPTQSGLTRASLPDALAGQSRILNFGFVIKASVPAATFTP